jgi:hypothetical protein
MRTSGNKHFGNPFTGSGVQGLIEMPSVASAVQAYRDWLLTDKYDNVSALQIVGNMQPKMLEQKAWILSQIEQGKLDGQRLLYMKDKGEYYSHADALRDIINDKGNQSSIEEDLHLNELEKQGKELIEKCKGSAPIAKKGMRTGLSKGHRWSIVKDLKGLPTHEQGGVDLSITNGKVHFTNGKSSIHAKHGMRIPKRVTESLDETKKSDIFTKGLEWYPTEMKCGGYAERGVIIPRKKKEVEPLNSNSWTIVADLKGKSHAQGGINLDITDGKVHFTRGKSKIHARCGCQIRSTSKVPMETIKKNKQKFGRK